MKKNIYFVIDKDGAVQCRRWKDGKNWPIQNQHYNSNYGISSTLTTVTAPYVILYDEKEK